MQHRALVASLFGLACAPALPKDELPSTSAEGALHGAVLLPLTVRSSTGLLGHVWSGAARRVDNMRCVLSGEPRRDSTRQHVEVLVNAEFVATFGVEQPQAGVGVAAEHRTDIAYSVDITGYETLAAHPDVYQAGSGCCVNGVVAEACEFGYVGRLLRGSGRLRYLKRLGAEASARVGPVLSASGGARYELLDETSFTDAFFAFVPEPLDSLCTALRPDQELQTFKVVAADNCSVRAYTSKGGTSRLVRSAYFPSAEGCWRAAAAACAETREVLACPANYRAPDGSLVSRDLVTGESWNEPPPPPAAGTPGRPESAPDGGPPADAGGELRTWQ